MVDPRLRYVAAQYAQLQGLRLVPLGVPFLAAAAWRAGWLAWLPIPPRHAAAWFAGGLVIAVAASFLIEPQYERQFGRVRPLPGRSGLYGWVAVLAGIMLLGWLQHTFAWTISAPALFVAGLLGYIGVAHDGIRSHYLPIAVACAIFANLGRLGVPRDAQRTMLELVVGTGLVAGGLGDHRVLRRYCQTEHKETYAATL